MACSLLSIGIVMACSLLSIGIVMACSLLSIGIVMACSLLWYQRFRFTVRLLWAFYSYFKIYYGLFGVTVGSLWVTVGHCMQGAAAAQLLNY
jgi:hypothetical protein